MVASSARRDDADGRLQLTQEGPGRRQHPGSRDQAGNRSLSAWSKASDAHGVGWSVTKLVKSAALPSHQKLVLFALADSLDSKSTCFPSMRTLAAWCGLSVSRVRAIVADLEQAGIVTRDGEARKRTDGSQRSNLFTVHADRIPVAVPDTPPPADKRGDDGQRPPISPHPAPTEASGDPERAREDEQADEIMATLDLSTIDPNSTQERQLRDKLADSLRRFSRTVVEKQLHATLGKAHTVKFVLGGLEPRRLAKVRLGGMPSSAADFEREGPAAVFELGAPPVPAEWAGVTSGAAPW